MTLFQSRVYLDASISWPRKSRECFSGLPFLFFDSIFCVKCYYSRRNWNRWLVRHWRFASRLVVLLRGREQVKQDTFTRRVSSDKVSHSKCYRSTSMLYVKYGGIWTQILSNRRQENNFSISIEKSKVTSFWFFQHLTLSTLN